MNVRRLRKAFGKEIEVSRVGRKHQVIAKAGGLEYRADERRFVNEADLADFVRSKLPVGTIVKG